MGEESDLLMKLSEALAARADEAKSSVAAIGSARGSLSGVLWWTACEEWSGLDVSSWQALLPR